MNGNFKKSHLLKDALSLKFLTNLIPRDNLGASQHQHHERQSHHVAKDSSTLQKTVEPKPMDMVNEVMTYLDLNCIPLPAFRLICDPRRHGKNSSTTQSNNRTSLPSIHILIFPQPLTLLLSPWQAITCRQR